MFASGHPNWNTASSKHTFFNSEHAMELDLGKQASYFTDSLNNLQLSPEKYLIFHSA